jgi:hypothetical protein
LAWRLEEVKRGEEDAMMSGAKGILHRSTQTCFDVHAMVCVII